MHAAHVHGLLATATGATVRIAADDVVVAVEGGGGGGRWSWYRRESIISSPPCASPIPPCLPLPVYDDNDDDDGVVLKLFVFESWSNTLTGHSLCPCAIPGGSPCPRPETLPDNCAPVEEGQRREG